MRAAGLAPRPTFALRRDPGAGLVENFVRQRGVVADARQDHRPDHRRPAADRRRRSAASASWARIWAFSLTSICWRAASQACGETIGGVWMAGSPPLRL